MIVQRRIWMWLWISAKFRPGEKEGQAIKDSRWSSGSQETSRGGKTHFLCTNQSLFPHWCNITDLYLTLVASPSSRFHVFLNKIMFFLQLKKQCNFPVDLNCICFLSKLDTHFVKTWCWLLLNLIYTWFEKCINEQK